MNSYLDFMQKVDDYFHKSMTLVARIQIMSRSMGFELAKESYWLSGIWDDGKQDEVIKESAEMIIRWWFYGVLHPIPLFILGSDYQNYPKYWDHPEISKETIYQNRIQLLHLTPPYEFEPTIDRIRCQLYSTGQSPKEIFDAYVKGSIPPVEVAALLDLTIMMSLENEFAESKAKPQPTTIIEKYLHVRYGGAIRLLYLIFEHVTELRKDPSFSPYYLDHAYKILAAWYATGLLTPLNYGNEVFVVEYHPK